ncbi:MAG: N-acyl amino acid synthase FeeM domain-containing protein [Spirosomataceae bacterium]
MIIIREVKTEFEFKESENLLKDVFNEIYQFKYEEINRKTSQFNKIIFNAYDEKSNEIIGTITLSMSSEGNKFPSNEFFGFVTPAKFQNQRIVEMGRLVKKLNIENSILDKMVYISLLLTVKKYSIKHNVDRWIASVHTPLMNNIKQLGIPLVEIDKKDTVRNKLSNFMGKYVNDVNFISASMYDSYIALEKFQYLIDNKSISILISESQD